MQTKTIEGDDQQLVCKCLANLQNIARNNYEEFGSHGATIRLGKSEVNYMETGKLQNHSAIQVQ